MSKPTTTEQQLLRYYCVWICLQYFKPLLDLSYAPKKFINLNFNQAISKFNGSLVLLYLLVMHAMVVIIPKREKRAKNIVTQDPTVK